MLFIHKVVKINGSDIQALQIVPATLGVLNKF